MSEYTYLKDSVKKCVDYAMEQNDEAKRRIFTGLFEYTDRLVNESITVKALNDEEKKKWFDNEMFNTYEIEIERLNKEVELLVKDDERNQQTIIKQSEENKRLHSIIKEVREFIYKCNDGKQGINYSGCNKILEILDKEK